MRAWVVRGLTGLALVGLLAGTAALVACTEEPVPRLPPYDEELSTFSGIGGLPAGGAGGISIGGQAPEEQDAGTPDAEAPDSGEIEFFPDGG